MKKTLFDITDTQEVSVNGKETKSLDKAITRALDIIRDNVPIEHDIVHHKHISVEKEKYIWPWEKARWYKTIEINITIKQELNGKE